MLFPDTPAVDPGTAAWAWLALAAAVVATGGSLYLSLGMGLRACPLCFYQRTFVVSVLGVLLVGLSAGMRQTVPLGLLALPPAAAGLAVALFHVNLERTGRLECPLGVFGLGTAPQQSLAAMLLLTAPLVLDVFAFPGLPGPKAALVGLCFLVGALFAYGCIASAGPPCPPKPGDPFLVCRPPAPPPSAP
jgi:disulfide bond formation protein DsbB